MSCSKESSRYDCIVERADGTLMAEKATGQSWHEYDRHHRRQNQNRSRDKEALSKGEALWERRSSEDATKIR